MMMAVNQTGQQHMGRGVEGVLIVVCGFTTGSDQFNDGVAFNHQPIAGVLVIACPAGKRMFSPEPVVTSIAECISREVCDRHGSFVLIPGRRWSKTTARQN